MICDKCQSRMEYREEPPFCEWRCPKCGWAIASTRISDVETDETVYEIRLQPNAVPEKNQIAAVSHSANCNFLEAKKKICSGETLLSGKAVDIIRPKLTLANGKVSFEIFPEFPY